MGKLFNSIMLGVIILILLYFFNGSGIDANSVFSMLLNPSNWGQSPFYAVFGISGLVTGLGAIVIGLGAIIKQDWVSRAGIVLSLNTIVLAPYVALFTFFAAGPNYASTCINSPICSQLNSIGGIGQFVALLIVGPLFLYAFWACISWIFSPETTG